MTTTQSAHPISENAFRANLGLATAGDWQCKWRNVKLPNGRMTKPLT